ncbi:synaptic vesicular amine transporter-like [Cylas formicarius]|uniref:synaptic vesicular amine transporter-like n=1 Tax=Cylas formicarius TaxID=197179 RepID=UPI002958DE82|nr:synaptic vesicular amine transporter-like [Cylas formicarius]
MVACPCSIGHRLRVLKNTNGAIFATIYALFLLDNTLLTVVVPIIPDYLFSLTAAVANDSSLSELASLSPLQRRYDDELESSSGPLGTLLASKAFVQLLFTPLLGYVTSTVSYNVPLLVGSCNLFVAALLFAYGNSFGVLILARALHGSSSAAIAVSGMSILAATVPPDSRARVMPVAFGGIALGVLIGYPLGGACYQLLGKTAPFLFIAFFVAITIAMQLVLLDEELQRSRLKSEASLAECLILLRDKRTLILGSSICVSTSSMSVLESCVPIWLLTHFDPTPTRWQLGAIFIPDSVGYFLGSHFAGLLKVTAWRLATAAMVVAGLSCCFLPLATSLHQLTLPHFGLGLGVGVLDASLVPLLANLVERKGSAQYGPIYAFQQTSVAVAYAFGPLLAGQGVRLVGFPWVIRTVGFMNLVLCPLLAELEHEQDEMQSLSRDDHAASYSSLETIEE